MTPTVAATSGPCNERTRGSGALALRQEAVENRRSGMSVAEKQANAYAAITQAAGAASELEQRRLEQQGEVYARLASWTLDALGLASGQRVLEVGCGSGSLLSAAAARVGPTGRVIGIDRDPRLVEAAKAHVAHLPWVEVVEA